MKRALVIVCLLLSGCIVSAQNTVLRIGPASFDKAGNESRIAGMNGWIFKNGNNINWSEKDIDTTGWSKLKPTDLTIKNADKNGRAEGWFRIKIIADSSLTNLPLGIKMSTWAATDLYIDGKHIISCGNTGLYGQPYREYNPYDQASFPFDFKPGREYTLALHFVDYVSTLSTAQLKSQQNGLILTIRITGAGYNAFFIKNGIRLMTLFSTIWVSVCLILCLLFWLLYLQNRFEKNLRLIALLTSFITLFIFCISPPSGYSGMSYRDLMVLILATNFFLTINCLTIPVLIAAIFRRRITYALKVFLIIYFIVMLVGAFVDGSIVNPLQAALTGLIFCICMYYVVTSWKALKGAQWAIVAGTLLSFIAGLFYLYFFELNISSDIYLYFLLLSCVTLFFPLSLLVYVSLRFKEILKEVKQNAEQIVALSEEKKEQAINRQKILQEEVDRQTIELRTTISDLKSTQAQLIQSEKMASLGELTAGIAHEIQNPLNFVNNFSEVSTELLEEAEQAIGNRQKAKGNSRDDVDVEVASILKDIGQNLAKINHHGKRADAIVKGMLQHSQLRKGEKEPTDLNALVDEYLQIAYQNQKAKDPGFEIEIKTSLDDSIGKINIVPQDIAKVLVNVYNNACYACAERRRRDAMHSVSTIMVSTKRSGNNIEIRVTDNGIGIDPKIINKIFQPFFTTKPTGQGTGLGLSLAYDIVKAHGGEITVQSVTQQNTVFTIQIPVQPI